MFTDVQVQEIRRIARLEALRAAVFSLASESLDAQTPQVRVCVSLVEDELVATINFHDAAGHAVMGGVL